MRQIMFFVLILVLMVMVVPEYSNALPEESQKTLEYPR